MYYIFRFLMVSADRFLTQPAQRSARQGLPSAADRGRNSAAGFLGLFQRKPRHQTEQDLFFENYYI